MIQLTGINRNAIHLAPAAIASVTEAGASSQWNGICSIVRTFDGQVLEVRQRADDIVRQIKEVQ
ncbi:hypothetical protein [Pseudomonas juntendi]|uniref:Uncharacterized protein n=1 Tax=Pseudomonas juntendi TaxID=2666183 RepID=A0A7W2JFJ4_9PSED|nr:hypothetical protein [Pseudomonas juntendi]MBA6058096.1 hypothetical protein [Pseudomonas juntendi]MBA6126592.1 hypothetical protein [Pseudomonas juntendi]